MTALIDQLEAEAHDLVTQQIAAMNAPPLHGAERTIRDLAVRAGIKVTLARLAKEMTIDASPDRQL